MRDNWLSNHFKSYEDIASRLLPSLEKRVANMVQKFPLGTVAPFQFQHGCGF